MQPSPWRIRSSCLLLDRPWLRLEQQRVQLPDGREIDYHICHEGDWAAILPQRHDGRWVLVEHYRHPLGTWTLEFPGGNIDQSESAELAAQRELSEETGYQISGRLRQLTTVHPNAARSSSRGFGFVCQVVDVPKETDHEHTEQLHVKLLDNEAIHQAIAHGRLSHAAHIAWFYQVTMAR